MNKLRKEQLKQTLLALSFVNDMRLPQRHADIKRLISEQKWEDEEYVNWISERRNSIFNGDKKVQLSHIKFVKKFPEGQQKGLKENYGPKYRVYHKFNSLDDQLAIATFLHDLDLLNGIGGDYKKRWEETNDLLKLDSNSRNYGNISYKNQDYKCQNKDDMFFPFYKDWQPKWKEFTDSFASKNYDTEGVVVLKIDFKNSYNNLNWKDFLENPKNKIDYKFIYKIIEIMNFYKCDDCDQKEWEHTVPYGGNVESHIISNFLILNKMNNLIKNINNKSNNYTVDKYLSYADDIAIFIKYSDMSEYNKVYTKFSDKDDKNELISHFIDKNDVKYFQLNKDKSDLHFIKTRKEKLGLISSYTSISTINSLIEPEYFTNDNIPLNINGLMDKDHKTLNRTQKSLKKLKDIETISKYNFLTTEFNQFKIDEYKVNMNIKSIIYMLFEKSKTNKNKEKLLCMILDNTHIRKNLFKDFEIDNDFDAIWISNIVDIIYSTDSIPEDDKTLSYKFISKWIKKKDVVRLVDPTVKGILNVHKEIFDCNLKNEDEETADIKEVTELYKGDPLSGLILIIRSHSELAECNYKKINSNEIFNVLLGINNNGSFKDYWTETKRNMLIFFNNSFGERVPLIYYRFKYFISLSQNRIDYINYMQYLSKDIDKLADVNAHIINNIDTDYLKRIKNIFNSYSSSNDSSKVQVDKLWLIRMTSKILWENGSISTQTYTTHNQNHGDVLLNKFIDINRAIPEFRSSINGEIISIFSLIGSLYTHDLGMLLNGDVDSQLYGRWKRVYNEISQKTRDYHGVNSSSILMEWLGAFLDIDEKDVIRMSMAAIAHENGVENLPTSSSVTKINSYLLSILDLLDNTYTRSSILSRKLTGSIASDISIAHWLKHYSIRELKNIVFTLNHEGDGDYGNIVIEFDCFDLDVQERDRTILEEFIMHDLNKWLKTLVEGMLNEIRGTKSTLVDLKIKVNWFGKDKYISNIDLEFYRNKSVKATANPLYYIYKCNENNSK